jgi:pimeloyl-ACP methyl ester carboxylesterase
MYATIKNRKINYEISGKGKHWIVFVHGWGGSIKSLNKLSQAASAGTKYKTLTFDLPGFGSSDNPEPEWGVEEYAELVVSLLKELEIEKPIYFGHSFGGSLGIWIAAKKLTPIDKLVLCASAFKRTGKVSKPAVIMNNTVSTYLPFFSDMTARIKPFLYKIFFRNSDLAKFPHLEPNYRKIITHDLTPIVKDVKTPTLILWGERDTYTPVAFADELEEKIPNSKKVIFPFKSHNLPIRYFEDVWKEMKAWLK